MTSISSIAKQNGVEMAAVILCCRVFFETATVDELKTFTTENDIDWYTFINLAIKHRIRPIVYQVLHHVNVPPEMKIYIQRQHAEITAQNFKQAIETERVILLLKEHGVEAVPYKGISYSKQFYGNLVSRECSDIDMVIKPKDLDKAIAVLKEDKYQPELDSVYQYLGSLYYKYYKEYNLNKFKNGSREFHIELHWSVAALHHSVNRKVDNFLYQNNNSVQLTKATVTAIESTSHFSAMLIHNVITDTFKNLKNVIDIAQAIKHHDIKNGSSKLGARLADLGLEKALIISTNLTGSLFGISLPLQQHRQAYSKETSYFFNQLCSGEVLPAESKLNIAVFIRNRAMLQGSLLQKLGFYWTTFKYRFTPTESDFDIVKFPKSLFFVYYLMKPVRSLLKPYDYIEKKKELAQAE